MKTVQHYYQHWESNLGYLLFMKGSQHFGYYPKGKEDISEAEAQIEHHNIIAKELDLSPNDSVLDAGCGQGFVACDLANRFGCNVTGVDITPYIVKRAHQRSLRTKITHKTKFLNHDYTMLPFPDNSFDKLYTVETLCHAQDLAKALHELFRVLKPGGKAVFMEYTQEPMSLFTPYQTEMYNIIIDGTASPALPLFQTNNFTKELSSAGFASASQTDISDNFEPSLYRLYKYAKISYPLIKLFHAQKHFVNMTIGVEFYNMAKQGLLGYCVYSATKPGATIQ